MLRFENLGKRFGDYVLFSDLHHQFETGCVALCDENGSGKSTLLGILAGTIDSFDGDVWLDGHSLRTAPQQAKAALAYVPDDCMAYPFMTGRGLLELVASTRGIKVDAASLDLAHRFGLDPFIDKRFEEMSLGTRRKVFLTATALGRPSVILADEPGNGLDSSARGELIELFKRLGRDRLVLFSTHDPALARACDARIVSFKDLGAARESLPA